MLQIFCFYQGEIQYLISHPAVRPFSCVYYIYETNSPADFKVTTVDHSVVLVLVPVVNTYR